MYSKVLPAENSVEYYLPDVATLFEGTSNKETYTNYFQLIFFKINVQLPFR